MFKSGGYNVYPREIETVLESNKSVVEVAVVSAADPVWQEIGFAFVTIRTPIEADDLAKWCAARLANYKCPKRFIILDEMPRLPIGKIDRAALTQLANSFDEKELI
jgi:acyl-CoA synthetase (AMP-forming)/AMP-acid ligase II